MVNKLEEFYGSFDCLSDFYNVRPLGLKYCQTRDENFKLNLRILSVIYFLEI